MDRGATVSVQLTSEHYRRSPIVQGGMEIPCKVTVKIPGTCLNLLLMEKYKQLVEELYIEPKKEEILGSFLQPMEPVNQDNQSALPCKRKKTKDKNTESNQMNDIRSFFSKDVRENKTRKDRTEKTIITID